MQICPRRIHSASINLATFFSKNRQVPSVRKKSRCAFMSYVAAHLDYTVKIRIFTSITNVSSKKSRLKPISALFRGTLPHFSPRSTAARRHRAAIGRGIRHPTHLRKGPPFRGGSPASIADHGAIARIQQKKPASLAGCRLQSLKSRHRYSRALIALVASS